MATKAKRDTKRAAGEAPAAKREPAAPILGLAIEGRPESIRIDRIDDPAHAPDRMLRPGDEEAIAGLARSMLEVGQLQPVMVERIGKDRYRRVFGRRRIAAASRLGWTTILAVVTEPLTDEQRRDVVAVENIQRQGLTAIEETLAVADLMRARAIPAALQMARPLDPACGALSGRVVDEAIAAEAAKEPALVHDALLDPRVRARAAEQVASMLGKDLAWVLDRLYIGRLGEASRRLVLEGKLPLTHAREIAKIADPRRREELCRAYAAGGSDSASDEEPGLLDDLRMEVRRSVFALHVVPWRLDAAFAGRRACEGCEHNSATQPGLFGGGTVSTAMVGGRGTYASAKADDLNVQNAGVCTLPACYQDKLRAAKGAVNTAAKKIEAAPKGAKHVGVQIPAFVTTEAVNARVKERRKRVATPAARKSEPTDKQKRTAALREAEWAWREAMEARCNVINQHLQDRCRATPGLAACLSLFGEIEAPDDENPLGTRWVRDLIGMLSTPGLETLLALDARIDPVRILNPWRAGPNGIADAIAQVLGIEMEPAPTVESFLPAEFREKPAGKSKAAKAGPR